MRIALSPHLASALLSSICSVINPLARNSMASTRD